MSTFNDYALLLEGSIFGSKIGLDKTGLLRIPSSSNYFYINKHLVNDIGLKLEKGADYTLAFRRLHLLDWGGYKDVAPAFTFEPLRTTMAEVDFSAGELTIANAPNSVSPVTIAK